MNIINKYKYRIRQILICCLLISSSSCDNSLKIPRLNPDAVILAFGDSLTRGKGAKDTESYPAVLEKLINRQVINAGVSGELSEDGLKRFPDVLEKYSPDLLILCHGGNNILRKKDLNKMGTNVREMIRLAADRNIPIILLGVPRPGLFLSSAKIYNEIADTTDVVYIEDIVPDVLGDKSLKSDIAHPNGDGYKKIAEAVYLVLRESGAI